MGSLVNIRIGEGSAESAEEKERGLLLQLGELRSVIVALSESYSAYDREQVEIFLKATGVRHEFVATHEMENPAYRANAADRCYYCKDELFSVLDGLAK